jgi:hypothetical protein
MALTLTLALSAGRITTHESLKAGLTLSNAGDRPLTVPFLYDTSDAVKIGIASDEPKGVRIMSGLTGQAMMTNARLDPRPSLLELPAGEAWQATVDAGTLHYLMPMGSFGVRARYTYEPEDIDVLSELQTVDVIDIEPAAVQLTEEQTLLDTLLVMVSTGLGPERRCFLRQHTRSRPLASWYAVEIEGAQGADDVFASTGDYVEAPVADAFVERFVLWRRGDVLSTGKYLNGLPQGGNRRASLPPGTGLLPSADHDLEGRLHVYLVEGSTFHCCRWGEDEQLETVFRHSAGGVPLLVRRHEGVVHVLTAGQTLGYERLDREGTVIDRREVSLPAPYRIATLAIEPARGLVKALLVDAQPARSVLARTWNLALDVVAERRLDRRTDEPLITEASFDLSAKGHVDLLVATEAQESFYCPPDGPPRLFATEQARFWPQVVSDAGRVYLGVWRRGIGFRFIEYDRRDARFVGYGGL